VPFGRASVWALASTVRVWECCKSSELLGLLQGLRTDTRVTLIGPPTPRAFGCDLLLARSICWHAGLSFCYISGSLPPGRNLHCSLFVCLFCPVRSVVVTFLRVAILLTPSIHPLSPQPGWIRSPIRKTRRRIIAVLLFVVLGPLPILNSPQFALYAGRLQSSLVAQQG
jgi:hypothetical protein